MTGDLLVGMLRGEILSGRGAVVVRADGRGWRTYAIAREALHEAGRAADMRRCTTVEHDRCETYAPSLARPADFGGYAPDGREWGGLDPRSTNPHVPVALSDHARGLVVDIEGSHCPVTEGRLLAAIARGSADVGAEPPAVFLGGHPRGKIGHQWEVLLADAEADKTHGISAVAGTPDTLARLRVNAIPKDSWLGRVGDVPLGVGVTYGDGRVALTDRTRKVLAFRVLDRDRGVVGTVDSNDGWPVMTISRPTVGGLADLTYVAARTWRAGPFGLALTARIGSTHRHPWFWGEGPGTLPAALSAWITEQMDGLVEAELVRAVRCAAEPAKTYARVVADPAAAAWRVQFARSAPALSGLLLHPGTAPAIDAGREAVGLVSESLGIGRAVARQLLGRYSLPLVVRLWPEIDSLRRSAAWVEAAGDAPLHGAAWDAFVECSDKALLLQGGGYPDRDSSHVHAAALLRGIPGGWPKRAAALARYTTGECRDVVDMIRAHAGLLHVADRRVPGPLAPAAAFDRVAMHMWAGHGRLDRLLRVSRLWHADAGLRGRLRPGGLDGWPVPFDGHDLGDGWTARCLASADDLAAEGSAGGDADGVAGLDHCVGDYGWQCAARTSLILSLRLHGARVATVELTDETNGPFAIGARRLGIRQARGVRNAVVGPGVMSALHRLGVDIARGQVELRDWPAPDGFDPGDAALLPPDEIVEVMDLWRPYLPPTLAGMSVEGQVRVALELAR